jgi:hypothetical protein
VSTLNHYLGFLLVAAAMLAVPVESAAQAAPRQRGDVTASFGWLYLDTQVERAGNRTPRDNTLYGGVAAGWYWTEHLKTEIEAGAGTEGEGYGNDVLTRNGRIVSRFHRGTVQRKSIGIAQQYQFGRNAWFHPHVAAGVTLDFDTRTHQYDAIVDFFDPTRPGGSVIEPARTEGPIRSTTLRPHVGAGFKAYVSQRAFFRADVRVGGFTSHGVDDVLARIGFGFDF